MIAFLRRTTKANAEDGYLLLNTAFHREQGIHHFRSEISSALVDQFVAEMTDEVEFSGVDTNLSQALVDEIRNWGVPSPIIETCQPQKTVHDNLHIEWNDLSLRQNNQELSIGFHLSGSSKHCTLTLQPQSAWLLEQERNDNGFRFGAMAYESCPRLHLTGTLDNNPIEGTGWIDHQWGDFGWLRSEKHPEDLLCWVWLGINLDNGADVIVGRLTNRQTGEVENQSAIYFAPQTAPVILDDVQLGEGRGWTSRKSMTAYSLEWQIGIPSLGLELSFTPFIDDQEIPVFGLTHAIWEGVGTVSGTFAGNPIRGRARLELQGCSNVLDVRQTMKHWVERIDTTLKNFLPEKLSDRKLAHYAGAPRFAYDAEAQTEIFSEPVWDLLDRGAKHWRPIFGLLLLDALGENVEPYETLLSVMPEFIHNGSVIIDDIEDRSQTRRGDETLQLRYGLPTAINAGNMLYFLPILTLADHPHLSVAQREEIYGLLIRTYVQAHIGQGQDIYWSRTGQDRGRSFWLREELGQQILQAHSFKTAALIRAVAEMACIIAETSQATKNICTQFAENLGLAFQIVDDINNFTSQPEWGKVRGEDLAAGKTSFVIYKAVNLLPRAEQDELIDIVNTESLRGSEAGLERGIELIEQSQAFDICRKDAKALVEKEWPRFSREVDPSQSKVMLRLLITHILNIPLEM